MSPLLRAAISALIVFSGANAHAAEPPANWRRNLDRVVAPAIADVLTQPIVAFAIKSQNERHAGLDQAGVDALDAQWRKEREQPAQPLISAVLSNPTSTYLTRVQAQSLGLYTEIFVMDNRGLNVGQSNISSDFWQGDEAKWRKTYVAGAGARFVDAPEFRADIGVWVVQLNISVDGPSGPIGAATFEVNLTELDRRAAAIAR